MLVLRLFQWRKGKRMEKFSADYAGKCMTGSIMCVKADDAEVAIAAARKQGASELVEVLKAWARDEADRRGIYSVMAAYQSRGAVEPKTATVTQPEIQFCASCGTPLGVGEGTEPRCTCWDGTKGCTEHAPDCPCYKPDPKCTCGKGDAPIWLHADDCPCYKPPENEWSCPCEGSHVENEKCECSCHEKPQSTDRLPLEVIREADWGAPLEEFRKYINALVDRVNELSK